MIALATLQKRVSALLDRFNQPPRRLDSLLNEITGYWVGILIFEHVLITPRNREPRRILIDQAHLIEAVFVGFDDQVGDDIVPHYRASFRRRVWG